MMAQILRALLVEDDPSWQEIIGEILFECKLEVDITSNIEEATQALNSQPHCLAIVDLSLSPNNHNNIDGLRVLDAIRHLDPNCRAILLTGFATVELAVTALTDYGASTFLRKESFQRSQFREIVNRILVSPPLRTTLTPASVTAASTISANGLAAQTKQRRDKVLIVEDDAGWRSILEEILSDAGFQTHTCASFGEGFGFLRRKKFSLAVIDLSLQGSDNSIFKIDEPNMDGYQLIAATRAHNIPIIVVSGKSEPEEIQRMYSEYSISVYIEKRAFDRAAFRRAIDETNQKHQSQSELTALTEREREVLDLLAQGLTNREISEKLVITTNTVKRHLKTIFEKLDVHTRSAATAKVVGK